MDIQYAILGLLSGQPLTGYDLKKIIAESDLFYWTGNNNQIYNSLVALHKQGLLSQSVQLQENLPAKKIYTLTEQGRAALRHWLLSEPQLPDVQYPFLIQLAFTNELTTAELDGLLARYEEEMAIQVRMRQATPLPTAPTASGEQAARERFVWGQIHGFLLARWQAELEWVARLRREIAARGPGELFE